MLIMNICKLLCKKIEQYVLKFTKTYYHIKFYINLVFVILINLLSYYRCEFINRLHIFLNYLNKTFTVVIPSPSRYFSHARFKKDVRTKRTVERRTGECK